MSDDDRARWDRRYAARAAPLPDEVGPAAIFGNYLDAFPVVGRALDLACGQGRGAVWLALRGLAVQGVDVSEVAVAQARELARHNGVGERCRFDVVDLDDGLPAGPAVDIVYCARFRDCRLDRAIIDRLRVGGLLAVSALSEVGADAGPFRAAPGELRTAFAELELIADGEGDGQAWLLGRRR